MNAQCNCVDVLNPGLAGERDRAVRPAAREGAARANQTSSSLLAIRDEALRRRDESYAWLILALSSASVLVLSLWI